MHVYVVRMQKYYRKNFRMTNNFNQLQSQNPENNKSKRTKKLSNLRNIEIRIQPNRKRKRQQVLCLVFYLETAAKKKNPVHKRLKDKISLISNRLWISKRERKKAFKFLKFRSQWSHSCFKTKTVKEHHLNITNRMDDSFISIKNSKKSNLIESSE